MTGWNDGPTPYGCANVQDNLTIITQPTGLRTVQMTTPKHWMLQHSNPATIPLVLMESLLPAQIRMLSGLHSHKVQLFILMLYRSALAAIISVQILISKCCYITISQTLIRTYDPASAMSVTIDTALPAGTYYIVLDGSGNMNTGNYGSLGSYTPNGFKSALPIRDVTLNGHTDKNKHNLNWTIIADEPVKSQAMEVSTDGIIFKPLSTESAAARNFSYAPFDNTISRLPVT